MLYGLILMVHVIVCLILIAVILLQAGRGGGLSDSFGGGAAQSFFGTRGAVYLTRMTTACAILFMSTSLTLAILSVQRGRSLMEQVRPAASKKTPPPAPPKEPVSDKTLPPVSQSPSPPSTPKAEEPKPAAQKPVPPS